MRMVEMVVEVIREVVMVVEMVERGNKMIVY